MGTEGGDKCVDNVDKLRKKWWGGEKGTNPEEVCNTTGRQSCPKRPQSVAASVVSQTSSGFWYSRGEGWLKRIVDGRKKHKKKESGEFVHIKMATGNVGFGYHFCMG